MTITHVQLLFFQPGKASLGLQVVRVEAKISKDHIEFVKYFSFSDSVEILISYRQSFTLCFLEFLRVVELVVGNDLLVKIVALSVYYNEYIRALLNDLSMR